MKKRCRILPAGDLGAPPGFKKSPPRLGDIGGFSDYFSSFTMDKP
jgi:hypothetical protein